MKISKTEPFMINSEPIAVKPYQKYHVKSFISASDGQPYSSLFGIFVLDSEYKELLRRFRWIDDFSGNKKEYSIILKIPEYAKFLFIGYRVNVETPMFSDIDIEFQNIQTVKIEDISDDDINESFDNEKFMIKQLLSLKPEEEVTLEKNMVWILGTPRSGSTWLARDLLNHEQNILWDEPYIGWHLAALQDWHWGNERYFFSYHHKNNWLPYFKKLVLQRTFSLVQDLYRNVIIKEPHGSESAEILMECFPTSKLIFLLRDGRDVIDSQLDVHGSNTWDRNNPLRNIAVLTVEETRYDAIRAYAEQWKLRTETVWSAFQKHNPSLRLLVKYEDLRHDTFNQMKKIYEFLKIPISDEWLKALVEKSSFEKIPDDEKGPGKFNRLATPGAWKNNLTKEEQSIINSVISGTLIQFGYNV